MSTNRVQKFDELIRREVSIELSVFFPDDLISITQVHVSKDLAFAKIWVSSYKDIDEIVKKCKAVSVEIRKILSKKIVARRVPSLYFVPDKTEEKAGCIERILSNIKEKK
jgi:ribosome-binding factor A